MDILRRHGIQATPQRIAVAAFVLNTDTHPTADEVWTRVRESCPTISRATVYNTLNLFAEKGLLRPQPIREGGMLFDARVEPHHHFIDDETGRVYDVARDAVTVTPRTLDGFEVREYQVIMRGKRRS